MHPATFVAPDLDDYALLDSGGAEKLERFGSMVLRRPDPQALWRKRLTPDDWSHADLTFVRESDRGGRWEPHPDAPPPARAASPEWTIAHHRARFLIRPTPFKHVGLFPEQASNWALLERARPHLGSSPRLLDLFGYTGAASLIALQAGYRVTHVDASKTALAWFRDNLRASGEREDSARVLLDDALTFAQREVRRGSRYEAILLDPPHHGRGPKNETWQLETGLAPLVEAAGALAAERALVVLSTYAVGYSPLAFTNLLSELEGGEVHAGELALRERGPDARLLPCGYCARWGRGLELAALDE